ncbi:MAG: N-6 DNA methylase [Planctomycetes bacterium]|nr:N-6 DNA methylase [Planctomycetota bacterium]
MNPLLATRPQGTRTGPSAMQFASALTSVHNHIYANDGLSASEAFSEIVKVLLLKSLDEGSESPCLRAANPAGVHSAGVRAGEVEKALFDAAGGLFERAKARYAGMFRRDEVLHLKPSTLSQTMHALDQWRLSDLPYDVKGTAFQRIVSAAYRGERGQFFTPGPVTRLLVEMAAPRAGERVCDPACGTGGFLLEALRFARSHNHGPDISVVGGEINPGVARVALLQLMLAGAGAPEIRCGDTLANEGLFGAAEGTFDVVITNPPFGSQGKITSRTVLERYELGHRLEEVNGSARATAALVPGQVPDILFIERCLRLLRPGGRLGIVLPNGDLENSSLRLARLLLRARAAVLASVALPPETFIPFGTGVRASVLLLGKMPVDETRVFMGTITKIGYSGGKHPRETLLRDSSGDPVLGEDGLPVVDEDVSAAISAFRSHVQGRPVASETCFSVNADDLGDRFDPAFYSPAVLALCRSLRTRGAVTIGSVAQIAGKRASILRDPRAMIRYVELSDVSPDTATITNHRECRVQDAPSRAAYAVKPGDVLIGVSGNATGTPTQPVAYVTKKYEGVICSNGFRVLRPKGVSPFLLVALLRSSYVLRQIHRLRTGAAIPAVSDRDLLEVLVLLPERQTEQRIVDLLEKAVELHEQQARVLEEALSLAEVPAGD